MLEAVASLSALGVALGGLLGLAARHLRVEGNPLKDELEQMLPGSNCGQCGFPGCAAAAEALADGRAEVTLCPPGGRALAGELADTLGVAIDLSAVEEATPVIAFVNEDLCIGCCRCFQKCETDALVGAPKQIHAVLPDICTGCGKCIEVCPTECIEMRPVEVTLQTWHWPKPEVAASEPSRALAA